MQHFTKLTLVVILSIAMTSTALDTHRTFLRHDFLSTLSNFASPSTAMDTLQSCKDLGNTWNSITGKVDAIKGTWSGSECDTQCTAQKGFPCGNYLKDCCAMECQGSYFTKYCKFDLKLTKAMMKCGV